MTMGSDAVPMDNAIAVIGMAGRFPGAPDISALWRLLVEGREGITRSSRADCLAAGMPASLVDDPAFVPASGLLNEIEGFDRDFFGISPAEAALIDPQHRIFLECALHALENAGHVPTRFDGLIGVYAGAGAPAYFMRNVLGEGFTDATYMSAMLGNLPDYLASRVAHRLGLRGLAVGVQTACSTSLVATHLACRSLLTYECDMALAGGVSLGVPGRRGYLYLPDAILSPDGHCRPFDAQARGTVPGSGCGIVVLRRLEDALADGDDILAIIRGSAATNDGAEKVGFTAPGVNGQFDAISIAQGLAGISAASISYVEAHGTGTHLGDPIEIRALDTVFREGGASRQSVAIGSIKSNLGHLDAAAGVTGLIKTILMLRHRTRVPTLHFRTPNPELELEATPFYVQIAREPWLRSNPDEPLRAGVSSFGLGGTNCHVVLEEAPARPRQPSAPRPMIFPLSARSDAALRDQAHALSEHLRHPPEPILAEVAFTLQEGREAYPIRRAVVGTSTEGLALALQSPGASHRRASATPPVAFLFPGQGTLRRAVGAELYQALPTFRETFDTCAKLLNKEHDLDLHALLLKPGTSEEQLQQTRIAQPVLFVLEVSLALQWQACGVRPQTLLGHSVGEYAAAYLAGIFSLEDALRLVAIRGALIQRCPPGVMLSVSCAEEVIAPRLRPRLSLAAVNAPDRITVAGELSDIEALEATLLALGIPAQRLVTSHAFHSAMMDPALEPFADQVSRVALHPPALTMLSSVTGRPLTPAEATDPTYWAGQIRRTVRFADALHSLDRGTQILLEVGPGASLSALIRRSPPESSAVFSTLPRAGAGTSELVHLLSTAGELWSKGVNLEWSSLHPRPGRRTGLPGTAFQRERCWKEPSPRQVPATGDVERKPDPVQGPPDVAHWLHQLVWERLPDLPAIDRASSEPATDAGLLAQLVGKYPSWLIMDREDGPGAEIAERLGQAGARVNRIVAGDARTLGVAPLERGAGAVDVSFAWLDELESRRELPAAILHLLSFGPEPGAPLSPGALERQKRDGFYDLMHFGKRLSSSSEWSTLQLFVLSSGACRILEDDPLHPAKALLRGPAQVLPLELQGLTITHVDACESAEVSELLRAVAHGPERTLLGLRNGAMYAPRLLPHPLPPAPSPHRRIAPGGVYLITGGLGGVGRACAEYLARTPDVRVALLSRHTPTVEQRAWLDGLRDRVAALTVLEADVLDRDAVFSALDRVRSTLGQINGVIHAAGVVKPGFIASSTVSDWDAALGPKLTGTLNLAQSLAHHPGSWLCLCSSISAVGFASGQAEYAAANAFLDAFAQLASRPDRPVISIDWDGWNIGMIDRFRLDKAGRAALERQRRSEQGATLIAPATGTDALARILEVEPAVPQWIVLSRDADLYTPGRSLRSAGSALTAAHSSPSAREGEDRRATPRGSSPFVAPRTGLERQLASLWQETLGYDSLGIDDDFFDLGGDSLQGIRLLTQLRRHLKVDLPLTSVLEHATIRRMAELLEREIGRDGRNFGPLQDEAPGRLQESLVPAPLTPAGADSRIVWLEHGRAGVPPLFLFHAVDGGVFQYAALARELGSERPVIGIRALPSDLEAPEPLSIDRLAERYLPLLLDLHPRGPFHLLGASLGGLLAYELAQVLHRQGRGPATVLMLDTPTPADLRQVEERMVEDADIDRYIGALFPHIFGEPKLLGDLPPDLGTDTFHRMFRRLARDGSSYRPTAYPGRIHYFRARERDAFNPLRPELSWIDLATDGIEVYVVSGNHLTMCVAPHVSEISRHVSRILADADRTN